MPQLRCSVGELGAIPPVERTPRSCCSPQAKGRPRVDYRTLASRGCQRERLLHVWVGKGDDMADYSLITNPQEFSSAVMTQVSDSPVDRQYASVLRVLIYYIWRGAFESRAAVVTEQVEGNLGLLSLSIYMALLPILQVIRLGYPTDTLVLLRALMERIALLGYLHNNRQCICQYSSGKRNLQKEAMRWAKGQALENWMRLYGLMSNVAHSRPVGPAGHLLAENPIGEAFRSDLTPTPEDGADMTAELLAGVAYALAAADPIACEIIDYKSLDPFPSDKDSLAYLSKEDVLEFGGFLQRFYDKYSLGV